MYSPSRRSFLKRSGFGMAAMISFPSLRRDGRLPPRPPNVILIVADDLGYRELGCYGQTKIGTPHIDRLAERGMRFTQHYSGSPVCAPSRCVLMTGRHTGHARIRDNREIMPEGQEPLPADTATLPSLLRQGGYRTALIGKWGLGYPGSAGEPMKQGFDHFFGYNCQRHAHNHYPAYLWRNGERVTLEGNDGGETGKQYAPDLMEREALDFIRANRSTPFFLFFATTVPHLALQVPDDSLEEYKGRWAETPYDGKKGYLPQKYPRAAYAAMVTRMDRSVGRMVRLLEELDIVGNTLVLMTSDNGSTFEIGGYDPGFFKGTGEFRAAKGSVYEGGVRVPMIASWPGRIRAHSTTDHVASFQDILPTVMDIVGASSRIPPDCDGVSYAPTLLGQGGQRQHGHLYVEFPSYGGQQMVRLGEWKGVRQNLQKEPDAPVELYHLPDDIGEQNDVAADHPDVVGRIRQIMRSEHAPSKEFPFPALDRR